MLSVASVSILLECTVILCRPMVCHLTCIGKILPLLACRDCATACTKKGHAFGEERSKSARNPSCIFIPFLGSSLRGRPLITHPTAP